MDVRFCNTCDDMTNADKMFVQKERKKKRKTPFFPFAQIQPYLIKHERAYWLIESFSSGIRFDFMV